MLASAEGCCVCSCDRIRGATTSFEDADNLMTNPSLGFGVSDLTSALRQQRPRREIATLPAVSSVTSMQEAMSAAGSSPGITSPFAALARSPHDDANGSLAGDSPFEAEQKHQELQQHEAAQQLSTDGAGLQPGSFGSDQYAGASDHQTSELQHDGDNGMTGVHENNTGSEQQADMQSAGGGSRQSYRRKGRPKCVVM